MRSITTGPRTAIRRVQTLVDIGSIEGAPGIMTHGLFDPLIELEVIRCTVVTV